MCPCVEFERRDVVIVIVVMIVLQAIERRFPVPRQVRERQATNGTFSALLDEHRTQLASCDSTCTWKIFVRTSELLGVCFRAICHQSECAQLRFIILNLFLPATFARLVFLTSVVVYLFVLNVLTTSRAESCRFKPLASPLIFLSLLLSASRTLLVCFGFAGALCFRLHWLATPYAHGTRHDRYPAIHFPFSFVRCLFFFFSRAFFMLEKADINALSRSPVLHTLLERERERKKKLGWSV